VPVNLRTVIEGNQVTLLWDAVPGGGSPEQYLVEAGVTPGGLELPIQLTHSAERTYSAPVPNGVYFVRIRALFAGSIGPRSEEIVIVVGTSLVTIPGAPTGLASVVQGSSVMLSWRAPIAGGAATAYVIEAGSSPGLADIATVPVGGTAFATTGVPAGSYYVRVRGMNGLGAGPSSNEIRLDIGAGACDAQAASPLLLPPTVNGSQVTLSWTPSAAQQYRVLAGTAPGVMNLVNHPTGQAVTAFVATAPAGIYYVQVVAENACGASAPSNEVVVTVADPLAAPGAPAGLSAAVNGSSVTLTWVPPAGGSLPTSYLIEAGSAPGAADLAQLPTGNATALFGADGVPPGTYHVRVRAMNAGGVSTVSNEIVVVVQ
jgi:predicted phage tail protein